jgi:predicted metal-dependent phosphoesterase TrpH
MAIDLHTHTTHSDGTFTPENLLKLAKEQQLSAISITDHDIATANEEGLYYSKKLGLNYIPGVELSIRHELPGSGHLHILGLFIDHKDHNLNKALDYLRDERSKRNQIILTRLEELGKPISMEELQQEAGEGSVCRPHIASLMMKKGYVLDVKEAFRQFLTNGAPAYVEKEKLEAARAIELIHNAGGMAVISHPISLGHQLYADIADEIITLKKMGLEGIEVYYPSHSKNINNWLQKFARDNDLLMTGGSDFHGAVKPEIQLGTGYGDLVVPDQVYWDLMAYMDQRG